MEPIKTNIIHIKTTVNLSLIIIKKINKNRFDFVNVKINLNIN